MRFVGWTIFLVVAAASAAFGDDLTVASFSPYAGQTNILLQATGNIFLSGTGGSLTLPDLPSGTTGLLSVEAENNIIVQANLSAGLGWSLYFEAGNNMDVTGGSISVEGSITIQTGGTTTGGMFPTNWSSAPGPGGTITIGGDGQGGIGIITNGGLVYSGPGSPPQLIELNSEINCTNISAAAGSGVIVFDPITNSMPFSYQWLKNSTNFSSENGCILFSGETGFLVSLTNIHRADAGFYSVVASNAVGMVTNSFQLHVLVPQRLRASVEPTNQTMTVAFGDADGEVPTAEDPPIFVIQTSTNLVDWTNTGFPIQTNASGGLFFQPRADVGVGKNFYRILSQ